MAKTKKPAHEKQRDGIRSAAKALASGETLTAGDVRAAAVRMDDRNGGQVWRVESKCPASGTPFVVELDIPEGADAEALWDGFCESVISVANGPE